MLLFLIIYLKVPLGLIFKNENSNDDMIEILTELHEKYLPLLKTTDDSGNEQVEILQKLFFGGDQRNVLGMPDKDVLMATATLRDWKDLSPRLKIGMQVEYFIRSVKIIIISMFREKKLQPELFKG